MQDQSHIKLLENFIIEQRDIYYNHPEQAIDDSLYDNAEKQLRLLDPNNTLLTKVGSDIRDGKVKLPIPMGSLDQVYNDDMMDYVKTNNLLEEDFVISTKCDGTSIELCFDKGQLYSAFSRGDGVNGADVTRHAIKIKNIPQSINYKGQLIIRSEVVFPKSDIEKVLTDLSKYSKTPYKNSRNCVAGQMNAESSYTEFYDTVHVVCYEIMNLDINKTNQLSLLTDLGLNTVGYMVLKGKELSQDNLTLITTHIKQDALYEADGIVLDIDNVKYRVKDYSDKLNPSYAKKFKILQEENIAVTTVTNIEYNASKDNYLKPIVNFYPVELNGVTISCCTGFNGKFIVDNGLGKGAIIQITRNGDVIPYCHGVIQRAEEIDYPSIEYKWSDNEVDFIAVNETDEANIQKLLYFFVTLDIGSAKIGNVTKLYDNLICNYVCALNATIDQYISALGNVAGTEVYTQLHEKMKNIDEATFASAIQIFGRGISVKKLSKLVSVVGSLSTLDKNSENIINGVEGFSDKTTKQIVNNIETYKQIVNSFGLTFDKKVKQTKGDKGYVVFTGIRDKQFEEKLQQHGYTVGDSKTQMTVLIAKDVNSKSSKIEAAKSKNIPVMTLEQAKKELL